MRETLQSRCVGFRLPKDPAAEVAVNGRTSAEQGAFWFAPQLFKSFQSRSDGADEPCRHQRCGMTESTQATHPLMRFRACLRTLLAQANSLLLAVLLENLTLQSPGVSMIVVRKALQHLVEAVPYVCAHGRICDKRITAAQRFG